MKLMPEKNHEFARIMNCEIMKCEDPLYYMSVGQKLTMLKICLTIATVMILCSLEVAPEDTIQLRGLIKGSN